MTRAETYTLSRWIRFRDEQLELLADARKNGEPTDILTAVIRLAEHHIAARNFPTQLGEFQCVATVRDLEVAS